jgi:hypothetical protein
LKNALLIFFFLSIANLALAQFTITGKVGKAADNKPLESATVFVNKTSYATKTDKNGNFILQNVRSGHYELIVSMVGFKTYSVSITVQSNIKLPAIKIEEKNISLTEVSITSAQKLDNKYMNMFKREILGTSKFGRQSRIINPKVIQLDFDQQDKVLKAYTTDFMIIENQALGYRLKYLLEDFERNEKVELISYVGYVLFESLAGDDKQRKAWNENRIEAYTGSLQHFFRSVLGNNVNKDGEPGFLAATDTRMINKHRPADTLIRDKIRSFSGGFRKTDKDSLAFWSYMLEQPRYIEVIDTTKLKAKQIAKLTDQKGLYALQINSDTNYINKWGYIVVPGKKTRAHYQCDTCQFKNSLYVTYIKDIPQRLGTGSKKVDTRREESFLPTLEMKRNASLISIVDDHVFFDWNGVVVNPMSLKLERYWAGLRLGDLLPIDYLPDTESYSK